MRLRLLCLGNRISGTQRRAGPRICRIMERLTKLGREGWANDSSFKHNRNAIRCSNFRWNGHFFFVRMQKFEPVAPFLINFLLYLPVYLEAATCCCNNRVSYHPVYTVSCWMPTLLVWPLIMFTLLNLASNLIWWKKATSTKYHVRTSKWPFTARGWRHCNRKLRYFVYNLR